MLDLYKNIRSRRQELGLTQTELAHRLGYSDKSMIAKIEAGKVDLPQSKIMAFADALRTSASSLMGWEEDTLPPYDNIAPITTHKLPVLGSIACGTPIYAEEQFEYYVEVGTEIKADFILRAKGDSMIGAGIHDGDIIFIRKQPTVENGEMAAVCIGDEATLKRVYYYPESQKLVLQAENPKYEPMVYVGQELEGVRILGRAVAFQSDII